MSDHPHSSEYRMRPDLQRVRYIVSAVLILFSLVMIGYLIRNRETSALEYLLWIASIGLWIYLIWTTNTARLQIFPGRVEYSSGREHIRAAWQEIGALHYLASGPTLLIGEQDVAPPIRRNRDRRPKVPLYLFMYRWATLQDWQADPVGREILLHLPQFFESNAEPKP